MKELSNGILVPLILSLLFFWRKALQYISLGSYVPLLLVLIFSVCIIYTRVKGKNSFYRWVFSWFVLVAIWSCMRLFFSCMNYFFKTLKEFHLNDQFGIRGVLLSVVMLGVVVYGLRCLGRKDKMTV